MQFLPTCCALIFRPQQPTLNQIAKPNTHAHPEPLIFQGAFRSIHPWGPGDSRNLCGWFSRNVNWR
jgi:hypothetical protein